MQSRRLAFAFAAMLVALAFFPLVGERFYIQFFAKVMILAVFAMSLDLLVGAAGLVSFGHALYFGAAGYVVVMLMPEGVGGFWALAAGGVAIAAAVALLVGVLVLRTSGIYFIMVTLAFAQMGYYLVHDTKLFGGSDGKYLASRPSFDIFGWPLLDLATPVGRYYLAFGALLAVYGFLVHLLRTPFGRVLAGIRENEARMRSLGFRVFRYKLAVFVLAGALAGLAGVLAAIQDGVMNPEHLSWHRSGAVLLAVILGGTGTLAGPALGAAALMALELVFSSWTKHWQLLMGGFIVAIVLFAPKGLAGLIEGAGRRSREDA